MSKTEVASALTEFVEAKSKGNDSLVCTVIEDVDLVNNTCYCEPINGDAAILNVKLTTNITGAGVGFLLIPKKDSLVVVTFLDNASAYVSMVSEVDEVNINGKTLGGLVKVIDLTTKLNNLENRVNSIGTDLAAMATSANSIGSSPVIGTALGALITTAISNLITPLTLTVRANIENTLIKQGDGT